MAPTIRSRSAWVASSNASNATRAARALDRASARAARSSSRSADVAVTVRLLQLGQEHDRDYFAAAGFGAGLVKMASTSSCGRGITCTETTSPVLLAATAPASVAALTAPTSPRTITVTRPPPICSRPSRTTLAAFTIASAASIAPTSPRVSIRPSALVGMPLGVVMCVSFCSGSAALVEDRLVVDDDAVDDRHRGRVGRYAGGGVVGPGRAAPGDQHDLTEAGPDVVGRDVGTTARVVAVDVGQVKRDDQQQGAALQTGLLDRGYDRSHHSPDLHRQATSRPSVRPVDRDIP